MVGRLKKPRTITAAKSKVGGKRAWAGRKLNKDGTERKKRRTSVWPEWFVYMIVLTSGPNKGSTYIGKTYDYEKRLRQHNCEFDKPDKGVYYGAKATRTKSCGGLHKWAHVWVVGGFTEPGVCETHALSFEHRVKHLAMRYNKGEPQTTKAYKYLRATQKHQTHVHRRTRLMLIACCLSKWGPSTLGVQTRMPPLTVHWFGPDGYPKLVAPSTSSSNMHVGNPNHAGLGLGGTPSAGAAAACGISSAAIEAPACPYLPVRCTQVFHPLETLPAQALDSPEGRDDPVLETSKTTKVIKVSKRAKTNKADNGDEQKTKKPHREQDDDDAYVPPPDQDNGEDDDDDVYIPPSQPRAGVGAGAGAGAGAGDKQESCGDPKSRPTPRRRAQLIVLSDDDES